VISVSAIAEIRNTIGRCASSASARILLGEREPVHVGHVHVDDRDADRIAVLARIAQRSERSPPPTARLGAHLRRARERGEDRAVGGVSSTISTRSTASAHGARGRARRSLG
jgi:hypothetical protein